MSGDYTKADLRFKVQKAARYVRIFGLSRTLIKIKGQYHMKAAEDFTGPRWTNPDCDAPDAPERCVAIVGCGLYSFGNIGYYLRKRSPRFLRAAFDLSRSRAKSLTKTYGGAYAAGSFDDILADPQIRIVFIASNHASHAEYAIKAIEAGKHVHIEKPHVTTADQLNRLMAAMRAHPESKVFLGFNRPRSTLFARLMKQLRTEAGPLMINWFIAGHEIPEGHWYFDEQEGGRVLGNLCHWTDLTLHLVGMHKAFPCRIVPATPAGAKSDFVVSVMFADGSCASITFSAKGHTFEGVREVLNLHRGNLMANLTDFGSLTLEIVARKQRARLRHRDHGHEANLLHSFNGAVGSGVQGEDPYYIEATARFFLAIREAIDSGRTVVLEKPAARSTNAS